MSLGNPSIARCAAVWLSALAVAAGTVTLLAPDLRPASDALDFEAVVVTASAWALVAAAFWALAVTTAVVVPVMCSAPVPHRGLPAPLRRVLLRACGAVVAGGLVAGAVAGPAAATPGSLERDTSDRVTRTVQPPAGPQPASGPVIVRDTTTPTGPRVDRVTVRPGDSLWRIAEATLREHGLPAGDADVAAYWPRIHDANRALVGPDPHLVRPGVPLVLPAPDPQET